MAIIVKDKISVGPDDFRYWPYYCEENIYHLCRHIHFAKQQSIAVVISNTHKTCALWRQQGALNSEQPVVWDYHVILLALSQQWRVWDFDSTLPLGIIATEYFSQTFANEDSSHSQFSARFRLFKNTDFVQIFSSNRNHMLDAKGNWISAPPPWPAITKVDGVSLEDLIDMRHDRLSDTLSLVQIQKMLGTVPVINP